MGNVGAATIREFQETEIIIAPSIKTEGKLFQTVQNVGMGLTDPSPFRYSCSCSYSSLEAWLLHSFREQEQEHEHEQE